MKIFKLPQLRASSRSGCLLLKSLCHRGSSKNLTTYEDNFQDGYALAKTHMTSQVTCSLTLVIETSQTVSGYVKEMPQSQITDIPIAQRGRNTRDLTGEGGGGGTGP